MSTPKLIEVTLAKPHTHAGQPHPAGAKIRVTEPQRDWLAEQGIIPPAAASARKNAE